MKKFTKRILLTALCLFVAGLLIIIFSVSRGIKEIKQMATEGITSIALTKGLEFGLDILDNGNFSLGFFEGSNNKNVIYDSDGQKTKIDGETEIKKINIEVTTGDVEIVKSDDEYAYYSIDGIASNFQADINSNGILNFKIIGNHDAVNATIYLPENDNISEYNISMGAGNLDIDKIPECEKSKIKLGAGDFDVEEANADTLEIECGAGDIDIQSLICDSLKVKCAAGDFSANLAGKYDDYNYNTKAALGNIEIGGKTMSGTGGISEDNGTDKSVDVECAFGNIEISFE